jgi:hypothetical protein
MGLFDCIENAVSGVVHTAEDVVGGAVNTVEGVASGAVNLAGGVLNGALGIAGGVLNGAEGILGGVLGPLLGGPIPLPFSGLSSVLNNPAQLATNLSSASSSLGTGINGINFDDIASLEQKANDAQAAAQSGDPVSEMKAQQALMNLQMAVQTKSQEMNIIASMEAKTVENSKVQG